MDFSLIAFVVGIIVFFKGSFRLAGRTIVRPQSRTIGLILIAPIVVVFCASFLLVINYIEYNENGTVTLPDETVLIAIAERLTAIQLVTVIAAVSLVLYIIFSKSPSMPAQQQPQQVHPVPQQVPDIMTVAEAAAYMRVSENDVLELIEQGRLGAARIGSTYRIARIAVDDFMGRAQP